MESRTDAHPLMLMTQKWRVLNDHERSTVVMLHETGLWVEFATEFVVDMTQPWDAIVRAMEQGALNAMKGHYTVEVESSPTGARCWLKLWR